MTMPCGGVPRESVCITAELDQISAPPPAQALPVMAQPGPLVDNGRRFISVPWVLCTMHPSTERAPLKGAGSQQHSATLLRVLAGLREQGIAAPWDTSIRFFRGGQGSTCFPWSPIPRLLQHVRRTSGLDPLHPSQVPVVRALQSSVLSSARRQR